VKTLLLHGNNIHWSGKANNYTAITEVLIGNVAFGAGKRGRKE
jgi:hypothetical protein